MGIMTNLIQAITTTRGDIIRRGATGNERVAAVTTNRVVRGDGTDVVLGQIDDPAFFTTGAAAGSGAIGIVTTAAQTFGGQKGFAAGYYGNTPTVYDFTAWNPSSATGETTTNPSAGTATFANADMTTGIASGTLTVTFNRAGYYHIIMHVQHTHTNSYSTARFTATIGGTATRSGTLGTAPTLAMRTGVAASDTVSISISILVSATAAQTFTFLPAYNTDGITNTAQHTADACVSVIPL